MAIPNGTIEEPNYAQLAAMCADLLGVASASGVVEYVNPAVERTLGFAAADLVGRSLPGVIHPDDLPSIAEAFASAGGAAGADRVEFRAQHARGGWVWLSLRQMVRGDDGRLYAVVRDVSRRKQEEAIDRGQRAVLEAIATGEPLPQVIARLVQFVEALAPGMTCSVLSREDPGVVHVVAAPSLPADYLASIEGVAIGPAAGSCGTAMFLGARVIVGDVGTDARWDQYRAAALAAGLRSCWSEPYFSGDGRVLGALAMYGRTVRTPSPAELKLLETAGHLAGIAVESRRAIDELGLYRRAVEHLGDLVVIAAAPPSRDETPRIVYANPAFERRTGWMLPEVLGRVPTFLFGEQTSAEDVAALGAKVRAGRAAHVYLTAHAKGGTPFMVDLDVLPIIGPEGWATHWVGVGRDVTARKRAEAELRRSQELFSALSKVAPMVVWAVDRTGRFTQASGGGIAAAGLTPEAVVGTSSLDLLAGTTLTDARGQVHSYAEVLPAVLEHGESFAGMAEFNGVHFEIAAGPLHGEDGAIEGLVCAGIVVSDRVRLETQLRHAQKMEAVGRLAGGVAHDFNNVLTAILGFAWVAQEEAPGESTVATALQEIIAATRRASDLTKRLLVFSRQQVLQPRSLALNDVVQNSERLLQRLIGEDVVLRSRLTDVPWKVRADPSQLEQVVMNLALNARDAMPYGGALTLEVTHVRVSAQTPAADPGVPQGEWVMLTVSDTGVGMDQPTLSRVFEPFFTTKAPGRGTGLGLSTVYGIVTQSGGQVHVSSAPGRGTTFRVYLPRSEATKEVATISAGDDQRSGQGLETVLVAEDDRGVRDLIRLSLKRFGYKLLVAASGEEALELAAKHEGPLPILVTDVVMPRMSGPQLRDRLLAIRPETRVLFLSGYTDDEMIKRGVLEDGVAFLQKPFPPEVLARKVREVLDQA